MFKPNFFSKNPFLDYLNNLILKTDSYKLTHWKQYPEGTTKITSYMEARKGAKYPTSIFFGLQPYLKLLEGKVITAKKIRQANKFSLMHFGHQYFNKKGWTELLKKHGGYLPVRIKALPEGTQTKTGTALLVIENLDPSFPWLTNFLETLLMKVWYTVTISTNSFYCRKLMKQYLDETSDNTDSVLPFMLHDFGYRGVSSEETAGLGGMSHLTNFFGTDTLLGIIYANLYYNTNAKTEDDFKMYGFSVSASEHSTATPHGEGDGEFEYMKTMLKAYPKGIVSMVADSYNVFEFAKKLRKFKAKIMKRDGRVVVRPDSGDPVEVNMQLVQILWEGFGGTTNSKGYKVLTDKVRIIQGDGIDYEMIGKILEAAKHLGFSAENFVFGSGGGLLQKFDRDTLRFAIKCCYAIIGGKEVNVQKNPATDSSKKSKTGLIKNIVEDGEILTVTSSDMTIEKFEALTDELITVFENGEIKVHYDFDEIRAKISSYL